jgi:hypothetical protein
VRRFRRTVDLAVVSEEVNLMTDQMKVNYTYYDHLKRKSGYDKIRTGH